MGSAEQCQSVKIIAIRDTELDSMEHLFYETPLPAGVKYLIVTGVPTKNDVWVFDDDDATSWIIPHF